MVTTAYRVKGSTNDVTSCEYCGREELKGTVVLAILDDEGNETGDVTYFGTGCAATAGKRTVKAVRADVKAADAATLEAKRAAHEHAHKATMAARNAWIRENVGPDALDNPRKYGYSSVVRLACAAMDAIGK